MLLALEQRMLKLENSEQNKKDAGLLLHLDRILWKPRCKATRNSLRRARRFEVYAGEKRSATNSRAPDKRYNYYSGFRKRELHNLQDPTQDTSILVAETKVNIQVGKVTGKGLIPVVG
jgi:hypothetical protein